MEIIRHHDAAAFLDRARGWLLKSEGEHNLILGLSSRLLADDHGYGEPILLVTAEEGGEVMGCAWCTPPWSLGFTRFPPSGLAPLARLAGEIYAELPGLHGPREVVESFLPLWATPRDLEVEIGMELRIYQLESVAPPQPPAAGELRGATADDLELLTCWATAFQIEIVPDSPTPSDMEPVVTRLIDGGKIFIWEDGDPVAMTAAVGPTPNGIRINLVYTPPDLRRRGYATACVAGVSQRQLESGRRFCFLYADLANPVSNSIYQRIGYRAVRDVVDIKFIPPEGE